MTRYLIFAVVGAALVLVSISGTSVAVAFPDITSTFDTNIIMAGWILSISQLVSVAVMPLAGKAGEVFGRKRTFLASVFLFAVGSLLCAMAPNIVLLILFRFIQALGTGSFLPLATGIVADEFPRARQQAIGFLSSIFPIGQIIGPNIGGWLTASFGWRAIFWFNIPLAILTFIAAAFLLSPGERKKGYLDLVGAGLFTGAIFAFITAISEIGNSLVTPSWVIPALLLAAAAAFLVFFIRREGRSQEPIIDLQLFKQRPFLAANTYNLLYGAGILGTMSFVPLYAVSVYHMSTLASGVILTPRSIGMVAASIVTSTFLPRWGYRWPMLVGTTTMALSLVLLGLEPAGLIIAGTELNSSLVLGGILLLSGIGMGVAAPAANNACIELMPHRVSTITGVRGMFRQSGGTISIAVTTLLLNNMADMSRGFAAVFFGMAAVTVLTIPFVFLMPKAP